MFSASPEVLDLMKCGRLCEEEVPSIRQWETSSALERDFSVMWLTALKPLTLLKQLLPCTSIIKPNKLFGLPGSTLLESLLWSVVCVLAGGRGSRYLFTPGEVNAGLERWLSTYCSIMRVRVQVLAPRPGVSTSKESNPSPDLCRHWHTYTTQALSLTHTTKIF